jgi:hypothetical protein
VVVIGAGIAAILQWWKHQPYALIEPLLTHIPLASWTRYLVFPWMELAVLLAPVFSLFLRRRMSSKVYVACAVFAVLASLALMRNPYDLLRFGNQDIFGDSPQWVFLVAATYSFGLLPIVVRTAYDALAAKTTLTDRGNITFFELSVLLLPFACTLFIVTDSRENFFARYLLPVFAALTLWLVKLWSDLHAERPGCGIAAPLIAAIYCAFIVAQMHDIFESTTAVLSLTQWYTSQGMPRNHLEAGFAFDGWYQIQHTGYINDPRVNLPVGAYVNHDLPPDQKRCHNFFLPDTPSIYASYGIGEALSPCFAGAPLHAVQYSGWMPLRRHTVFIAAYAPKYADPAH